MPSVTLAIISIFAIASFSTLSLALALTHASAAWNSSNPTRLRFTLQTIERSIPPLTCRASGGIPEQHYNVAAPLASLDEGGGLAKKREK